MKQLIIFIGLMLLFVTGIIYQSDYSKTQHAEKALKSITIDSASGAVFCIDEAAYGDGYIRFNDDNVIEYVQNTLPPDLDVTITIFDDTVRSYENGVIIGTAQNIHYPYLYVDENGYEVTVKSPAVAVMAVKTVEDMYRLPFLERTEIRRSSMYTFAGRE